MRVQTPFNPRQARPGTTLKPAYRPSGIHSELEANEALLRYAPGGILLAGPQESAIVSAIRENESRLQTAQAKERATAQSYQQAKTQAYATSVTPAHLREHERQQQAYRDGAVTAALYDLEARYGYGRVTEKPVERPVGYGRRGDRSPRLRFKTVRETLASHGSSVRQLLSRVPSGDTT